MRNQDGCEHAMPFSTRSSQLRSCIGNGKYDLSKLFFCSRTEISMVVLKAVPNHMAHEIYEARQGDWKRKKYLYAGII